MREHGIAPRKYASEAQVQARLFYERPVVLIHINYSLHATYVSYPKEKLSSIQLGTNTTYVNN